MRNKRCDPSSPQPLSLILTFRNEQDNLRNNLPRILEIDNVDLELIAVDDFSGDNSMAELGALAEKYDNLRISSLNQETWYSVKIAQNIAIKAAKNDWIMVIPPSVSKFDKEWIKAITSNIDPSSEVIVNYSNIESKRSVCNLFYRTELFFQQLKSFGSVLNGSPYIISEENVAFKKENYFFAGGYRNKVNEYYANLELIINRFIKKKNTRVIFSSRTVMLKNEKATRTGLLDLLKKEIRIKKQLPFSRRVFFAAGEITGCLFIPAAIVSYLLIPALWPFIIVTLGIFSLAGMFIIKKALSRLNENKLFLSSLMHAIFFPFFKLGYRFYYNHYSRKKRCRSKR